MPSSSSGYPGISPSTIDTELSSSRWTSGKAYDISKLALMHFMYILKDQLQVRDAYVLVAFQV